MLLLLLLSMIGYSNSPCIWSDMSSEQQQMTINMYPNNGSIMRFYNGNFILGDNEVTFRLLDTLVSKQDCCYKRALAIHLFNKICINSDGALSESMGYYTMRMLINNPDCIYSFSKDPNILAIYAFYIANELSTTPESYSDFIKYIESIGGGFKMECVIQEFIKKVETCYLQVIHDGS